MLSGIVQTGLVNAEKIRKSRDEKIRELSEQLCVSVGGFSDDDLSDKDVEDFEDVCNNYLSKQKQDLQALKVCQPSRYFVYISAKLTISWELLTPFV